MFCLSNMLQASNNFIETYSTNQNTPITIRKFHDITNINLSTLDLSSSSGIQKDITDTNGRWQFDENGMMTFSPKVTLTGNASITVYYSLNDGTINSEVITINVIPQPICSQSIESKSFSVKDGNHEVFNMPATDYGFQFDIYTLDNSFNLKINGTHLITDSKYSEGNEKRYELEFQEDQTHNITFEDNTYWGKGSIKNIYQLTGNSNNPIIRILISPEGNVTMFGSKVSGGPLYKLKLKTGVTFNKITWHTNSTNEVTADQRYVSTTYMTGFGTGLKVRSCPCTKPGLTGTPDSFSQVGISVNKTNTNNFPHNIPNGFIALESNTKGMVITRVQNSDLITEPKEGMLVYDLDKKCVKMYNGKRWECLYISCNVHDPGATNTHEK